MTRIPNARRVREQSLGFLIQLIGRRIDGVMKTRLDELGIDVKVFANLMMLSERDGVTQRDLGRILEFPEYYTSRNVDLMVEHGFVERQPDPESRRSVLIFLTDHGREVAAELPKLIRGVNAEFTQDLQPDEREHLIALLQKVASIKPD